jgi:hypothetical protein
MPPFNAVIGQRSRVFNINFATEFLNYAREQKLHVCWLGVQDAEFVVPPLGGGFRLKAGPRTGL